MNTKGDYLIDECFGKYQTRASGLKRTAFRFLTGNLAKKVYLTKTFPNLSTAEPFTIPLGIIVRLQAVACYDTSQRCGEKDVICNKAELSSNADLQVAHSGQGIKAFGHLVRGVVSLETSREKDGEILIWRVAEMRWEIHPCLHRDPLGLIYLVDLERPPKECQAPISALLLAALKGQVKTAE